MKPSGDVEHELMSAGQLCYEHVGRALWVGGRWERITTLTHGQRVTVMTHPKRGYSSSNRYDASDSIAISKKKVLR